jgi:hypothetical protein
LSKRYGRRTNAPALDRRGDTPLPKSQPQVRAPNQDGHPVIPGAAQLRAMYFGGRNYRAPKLYKPFIGMSNDAANARASESRGPVYHRPMGERFGTYRDWQSVSMGSDEDAEKAMSGGYRGIVVGQRLNNGSICPGCNIAFPATRVCPDCD